MTPDLQREFTDLGASVNSNFRSHSFIREISGVPLVQFLVRPSFGNPICLDLLRSADDEPEYFALRTVWNKRKDLEAFLSPVDRLRFPRPFAPSIVVEKLGARSMRLQSIVQDLRALHIPVGIFDGVMGFDGTTFELACGDSWRGCRLNWWNQLPESWQSLEEVIGRLRELADGT